jgi:16S rRNA G1207 methylase RsmC
MKENQHYYVQFPDGKLKLHTLAASLRKHLYIFKTVSGVFSYRKIDLGTKVLVENMTIPKEPSIMLDLGCGYGVIGIVLSHECPESNIYLIDINKRAIWCAKESIKMNKNLKKKKIFTFSGDYFKPIENKNLRFDAIYMNPPISRGRKEFLHLCEKIPYFLSSKGFFEFVIRKKLGAAFILKYLTNKFPNENFRIVCRRSGYWVFRCFHK